MSLFDESANKKSSLRDTHFVRLMTGMPITVQLLEHDSVSKFQHWITTSDNKRVSVRCTGQISCPVCMRNASLGNDRNHPRYIPSQRRYLVNVVDLTVVKRSPNTGEVFMATRDASGKFIYPDRDSAGNSLFEVAPAPANTVKVLEGGPRLFQKIQATVEITLDPNTGESIDPVTYPMQIVRVGEGRDTDYLIVAQPGSKLTVNAPDYEKDIIDLRADTGFNREEVEALLSGTQLKDILAARKAAAAEDEVTMGLELFDIDPSA